MIPLGAQPIGSRRKSLKPFRATRLRGAEVVEPRSWERQRGIAERLRMRRTAAGRSSVQKNRTSPRLGSGTFSGAITALPRGARVPAWRGCALLWHRTFIDVFSEALLLSSISRQHGLSWQMDLSVDYAN